ncbi:MAG TPA: hypothetical protein VK474_10705 [Chthoniobacterales bacterium]|nr:hypothetical protein [Chthoniobacterales bacterium]
MDPQSLVILMRMVERILGVLVGGVLIYFGYRLFLDARVKRGRNGGSGDFTLAGGNKIKLSKVGPGVFFALFGTGLIVFSLTRSVSLTTTGPAAAPPAAGSAGNTVATLKFIGATSLPENDEERAQRRTQMQQQIAILNRAIDHAGGAERPEVELAVGHAKLALMERLWAEEWGDLADFREWLEKGGAPPAGNKTAVEIFQRR